MGQGIGRRGKKVAEDGFAKADDEDEVEAGDDEVVGGDVEIGGVVHAHAPGNGAHVGYAAGVDADGDGADLGKLERGAMSTEKEESGHCDNDDGQQSAETGFEGCARRPVGETARDEHQGNGQRDADIANKVVGFEQAGTMNPGGEVGYQEAYDIENGHGAYLVYPSPTSGQKHDEGWDAEEV